jgi:hypothetical protein
MMVMGSYIGGAPRSQKATTCFLGEGVSVLTSYALQNTPASKSSLFLSQRPHQRLHCDLPHPTICDTNTSVDLAMRVYVLVQAIGTERIALQVWDYVRQVEETVWIEPWECIVFKACTCWHAGYGEEQGDRLYVTFVIGDINQNERECVERDALVVVPWSFDVQHQLFEHEKNVQREECAATLRAQEQRATAALRAREDMSSSPSHEKNKVSAHNVSALRCMSACVCCIRGLNTLGCV